MGRLPIQEEACPIGTDTSACAVMLASPPAEVAAQMESHGVLPPITVCVER